jgi:hypothetical protein
MKGRSSKSSRTKAGEPTVNPREEQEEERVDRRLKALDREV